MLYGVDGEIYFSRNSSTVNFPTQPMYPILDQAVDSWLFPPSSGPAVYPAYMVGLRVFDDAGRTAFFIRCFGASEWLFDFNHDNAKI